MTSGSIAIAVGASAEELDHVKQCLSDWQCVDAPLNDEETEVSINRNKAKTKKSDSSQV
jgi:hypothetical protein